MSGKLSKISILGISIVILDKIRLLKIPIVIGYYEEIQLIIKSINLSNTKFHNM